MAIRLHGENATEAKDVQGLFKELVADNKSAGRTNPDFLPIEVPELDDPEKPNPEIIADRTEIRSRLIALYIISPV